jgi:putative ABC transport system permease protein
VSLLLGAVTVGLLLSFLSLGTFLSFRVLKSLDLTTDGAFMTGAAATCALLVRGLPPLIATGAGALAGGLAGAITGLVHTRLRVNVILAGILVSTALYSVDIWMMRGGNLSLAGKQTLFDEAAALLESWGALLSPDAVGAVWLAILVVGLGFGMGAFASTDLGLALRATGSSPQMARAAAIDTGLATMTDLALANTCTGLSGALFAQYQGFANVQMGIGMIVTGLASLILGEALFPQRTIGQRIFAALLGALTFRFLVAAALWAGLDPNALKLVTAAFVLTALTLPPLLRRLWRSRLKVRAHA